MSHTLLIKNEVISLTNQSPYVIGVDVGGTKIQIGAVTKTGKVTATHRYGMDKTSQATAIHSIQSSLEQFFDYYVTDEKPIAIGVGLVGHVDFQEGIWIEAINIPISQPTHLADQLTRKTGISVFLDNDVKAATLAEKQWGIGKITKDFVFLNVGTGIAAGIVSDNHLIRGTANYAGEWGHMVVETNSEFICSCGQRGCFEQLTSGAGIIANTNALLPQYPTSVLHCLKHENQLYPSEIFKAAAKNDVLATVITKKAIQGLCMGMTNLVNLVNPEYIIIGGGVLKDKQILQHLFDYISQHALPVSRKALRNVLFSGLKPDYVGMLGAASLGWLHSNE